MYQAMEEMKEEAEQRGKVAGRQEILQEIAGMRQEAKQIGSQDGELKKAKEVAKKLYEMGTDTAKIALIVGYSVETVRGWELSNAN